MKLGLLGDVHGNYLALTSVLNAAVKYGVERLLVTGDFVGYYFRPQDVLELLQRWDVTAVRGNHEDILTRALADDTSLDAAVSRYGSGLRMAIEQLTVAQLEWLCSLPHPLELVVDGRRILLCHGSPWDINQYIYPNAEPELLARCALKEYDLVVMGHTHYPMCLKVGNTLLVNPGSVGQPRNRQPGAHWALFDTDSCEATLCCERYDGGPVIAQSRLRHPDLPYLWEVLERT